MLSIDSSCKKTDANNSMQMVTLKKPECPLLPKSTPVLALVSESAFPLQATKVQSLSSAPRKALAWTLRTTSICHTVVVPKRWSPG